jgi:hypothetical protein
MQETEMAEEVPEVVPDLLSAHARTLRTRTELRSTVYAPPARHSGLQLIDLSGYWPSYKCTVV